MQGHKLRIDLQKGLIEASCECGRWQANKPVNAGGLPSEIMAQIERDHKVHVEEEKGKP
jgi:hypothetical protein